MEPDNRPYVDPKTEPGDAGTEEWADTPPGPDDEAKRGPLAAPAGANDGDGVVDESPAEEFISDPEAIASRKDEDDTA